MGKGYKLRTVMKIKINNIQKLKGERICIRHNILQSFSTTYEYTVQYVETLQSVGWAISLGGGAYIVIMDNAEDRAVKVALKLSGFSIKIWDGWIRLEDMRSVDEFVRALEGVEWK
jgi:hypothetical protein